MFIYYHTIYPYKIAVCIMRNGLPTLSGRHLITNDLVVAQNCFSSKTCHPQQFTCIHSRKNNNATNLKFQIKVSKYVHIITL